MKYLLIVVFALGLYAQDIPSEIPRDRKNTSAAVVMYFDESDSTYHYLRVDSLNIDIITELQTLNAKSFSSTTKQTEIIDSLTALITLITTLNGYTDGLETKADALGDSLSTIADQGRFTAKTIINGTATSSWVQVSSQTCNGFELKNWSNNELKYAFSGSPGNEYDIISAKTSVIIPYNNTNVIYIKGNGNYKVIPK